MTTLLSGLHWLAVLRIGVGLWWLESFRHKNKRAWFEKGSGIDWAASVAAKHPWNAVRVGFERTVLPRKQLMAYLVVYGELAIGLGLAFGFLTPVAAIAGIVLNLMYFTLMIRDWAEQGQNSMMILAEVVVLGTHAWRSWGVGHALGIF